MKWLIIISISTVCCRLMACLRGVKFDGSTGFTDSNDAIQREVGNGIWFSVYVPCVLPRYCYGYAIRQDCAAQLPASMVCIEEVN